MSVTIRPATLADEEAALHLIKELFAAPGGTPPDYTRERASVGFRYAVEQADADVLLAMTGDEVIGLASMYVVFPSIRFGLRCYLQDLVVTPSRRSRGIGRLLLDAASEWAREHGCHHLALDSGTRRRDAHRFYIAQGMSQEGLVFNRILPTEG